VTDNDSPLYEKSQYVWDALAKSAQAVDLLDEAIQLILRRKAEVGAGRRHLQAMKLSELAWIIDLEYDHLHDWHRELDNARNAIATENALLAEQYGHPDWKIDKED